MDAKLQILTETFKNEFSMHTFTRFIREFFNTIEIVNPDKKNINYLSEYAFFIASHTHIANYTDSERNRIAIFAVELRSGRSIERARSMQRNFISKLISNSGHDAAIVAFYIEGEQRWRLSLVRLDYEFAAGRAKMNITPAKRYSYLVGKDEPCHTAMEQLFPIFRNEQYNPTLDKIEAAFSIETVTKEFFDKYENKYSELKKYLDANRQFNEEAQLHQFTSEQFAKKLMGQLAFLYFLQKKGWLGVKVLPHSINEKQYKNAFYSSNRAAREIVPKAYNQTGTDEYKLYANALVLISDTEADVLAGCFRPDPWGSGTKTFIRELYDACSKNEDKNFFDDYLEPLFYEALNRKRGVNLYYKRFNCKIPFLNGGLFEPLEHYDWEQTQFGIPNDFFSNRYIKGYRDADGILDIFDRYNFTMNEDEPLEREVAVDPEMLGKIFENLLDAKDRKSKGAFYTPREIVHYMCQESLINYLVNETGVPYEDMKEFILYGELMKDEDCSKEVSQGKQERRIPESVYIKLWEIDKAMENVKVADPAVGSGAFPLGMLSEIIRARGNITEYFVRQIPADKKFDRKLMYQNRDPYRMKWDTIKNCIFAVDIEASAVDIAKLRLWLSLVVDQEVSSGNDDSFVANENRDPQPLPNLDYNIMCGNSLIDEFEGVQLFDESLLTKKQHDTTATASDWQMSLFSDTIGRMTEDLFKEQDRLFGEEDNERKSAIKKKIDKTIDDIIRAKLTRDNNTEGLVKYNESLKQKTKPYFLWKLEFARIFKEKGGFDIVIGNPPYVRHEKIQSSKSDLSKYSVYANTADLLVYFFERGTNLIKQNGFLCFITSNKYMRAAYGKQLRCFLKNSVSIKKMIDFKDLPVFDAAAYPVILISEKEYPKYNKFNSVVISTIDQLLNFRQVFDKKHMTFLQEELNDEGWIIDHIENNTILKKAFENSGLLGDLLKNKLKGGIKTGFNEAFIIDSTTRDQFINENKKCSEIIKPYIVGRDIKKYKELNVKKYLICTPSGWTSSQCKSENTWDWFYDNYKPIANHFIHHEEKLKKRSDQGEFWWELRSCDYYDLFNSRKIIYAEIAAKGQFTLDEIGVYCDMTAFMLDTDSLYILGLLNSKLITFLFSSISSEIRGGFLRWKKQYVNKLPIAFASEDKKNAIADLVNNINQLRKSNKDITNIEMQIDQLVYELYGLTDDEIKIIEEA